MNTLTRIDYITDQKEQFGLILQKIDTVNGEQLQVPIYNVATVGSIHQGSFVNNNIEELFEDLKNYLNGKVVLKEFRELEPIKELGLKALILGLLNN